MKLREYLLHETETGEFVVFTRCGWQIGCTFIDAEDLFVESLNPDMLDEPVHEVTHVRNKRFGNCTQVELGA